MAHTDLLRTPLRNALAKELSVHLTGLYPAQVKQATPLSLGEVFRVWSVNATVRTFTGRKLREVIVKTKFWHAQIRVDGVPKFFAQVYRGGRSRERWMIGSVGRSNYATRVSEAVKWIDVNAIDDPEVRLVEFPARFATFFWLKWPDESRFLLVSRPRKVLTIRRNVLYTEDEFRDTMEIAAEPFGLEFKRRGTVRG